MSHDSTAGLSRDEHADDPLLDAGLRAAYGPNSTAALQGVLAAIDESSGAGSRILLRDEPDEPNGLVNPKSAEIPTALGGTGRYQIAGEIARGGVGVVLKGRDVDLGREIALKILRAEHAANPVMIRRLVEEAQIGGQLQHPGVLPVYEMGLDAARRPFFAMKLVRGRTLAALLHDRPDTAHDQHRVLAIFLQVCQTVAYAHARGVVHRDLKPSNVMVGTFGEVQVVDWGLAKVLAQGGAVEDNAPSQTGPEAKAIATIRSGSSGSGSHSEAGSVLGTPSYMAPEQARGQIDDLDERCDVFALGAILCEILTGRPPFSGTRAEVLRQAREADLTECFGRLAACGADAELVAIATRCLDPAREARFRDASQVARELGTHLASVDERRRAAELGAAEARARASGERRIRWLTMALMGVVIVSLLAGGGLAFQSERHKAQAVLEHAQREAERSRADAAQARAEAERARADAERGRQLEAALALVGTLRPKGLWIMDQARHAPDSEAARWADALALTRQAVERTGQLAADDFTRQSRNEVLAELKRFETELRQRAERAAAKPR